MSYRLLTAGISRTIGDGLWVAGFEVTAVTTAAAARDALGRRPHAVVLAWRLPDRAGLDLLAAVRQLGYPGAVVVVAERDTVIDRVAALDSGADDCVGPAVDATEVAARVRAVLRRGRAVPPVVLRVADLEIDPVGRRAARAGVSVDLTPTEFSVLAYLAANAGRPVTKGMLLADVWQDFLYSESNVVAKYINMVRRKVERPGLRPLIRTVRGQGYVLGQDDVPAAAG